MTLPNSQDADATDSKDAATNARTQFQLSPRTLLIALTAAPLGLAAVVNQHLLAEVIGPFLASLFVLFAVIAPHVVVSIIVSRETGISEGYLLPLVAAPLLAVTILLFAWFPASVFLLSLLGAVVLGSINGIRANAAAEPNSDDASTSAPGNAYPAKR